MSAVYKKYKLKFNRYNIVGAAFGYPQARVKLADDRRSPLR